VSREKIISGVQLLALQRREDGRGWFVEVSRASALPKPVAQTNISFSRRGVIRGLHYHEQGQNDVFVCLLGTARIVVLDRESGKSFSLDIGDDNPVAVYVPGHYAHGFEALTDVLMLYHVTEEYQANSPDEQIVPWTDSRVRHLWSTASPILSERDAAATAS
jgi:dTDP-4-dehydrorhamnose 3,5-epimerase